MNFLVIVLQIFKNLILPVIEFLFKTAGDLTIVTWNFFSKNVVARHILIVVLSFLLGFWMGRNAPF